MRAAGTTPVSRCGRKEAPIAAAEKTLPTNLCLLIKSSCGYAVTNSCSFFGASDFILGETTCDDKNKMFELTGSFKPLHLMHLPLSGMDVMTVMETKSSCFGLEAYAGLLRQLIEELKIRCEAGVFACQRGAPRLLLTGWQGFG
ncbi:MAG: 2-hydroxyacyl-CoA dehydratase [Syntrophobacteraceae bacterium]|nr:2-hydroxyacyl-CoA dehydratase [Syntrophobacteraceae bacterium]